MAKTKSNTRSKRRRFVPGVVKTSISDEEEEQEESEEDEEQSNNHHTSFIIMTSSDTEKVLSYEDIDELNQQVVERVRSEKIRQPRWLLKRFVKHY